MSVNSSTKNNYYKLPPLLWCPTRPQKSFFWRQVGLRCLLRIDGETQLGPALRTKDLTTSPSEVTDVIDWITKFPKLLAQGG